MTPESLDPGDRVYGGLLPPKVAGYAGLSSISPSVGGCALTGLNDDGLPFARIADQIEKWL